MSVLRTRQAAEDEEMQHLAPCAAKASATRGRRYPQAPDAFRMEFDRDRDRILHCTAFRRLEFKTQVFVFHEGDHYRTRLTHSMETAQVARAVASALRLNSTLAEAIALAHDFGHAPFGHAGQDVLNELMQDAGGFEHNRQSLRVVDFLETRYPDYRGLNLCFETREGLIKHSTPYDDPALGEFAPSLSPSLEAQLVNLADEVAYTSHDLEDGLRARMLKPERLRGFALWDQVEKQLGDKDTLTREQFQHQSARHLKNLLITDMIEHTASHLGAFDSVEQVRAHGNVVCALSAGMRENLDAFRGRLHDDFYCHYRVLRMADKARKILTELFERYTDSPQILPNKIQKMIESVGLKRVVCDYLAGMTDRYAMEEYKRLFDPFARV